MLPFPVFAFCFFKISRGLKVVGISVTHVMCFFGAKDRLTNSPTERGDTIFRFRLRYSSASNSVV
jgi:hypothetical protein